MSNSVTDERAKAWIDWGLTPVPFAPDPTEIIRVDRVPIGDLLSEIGRNLYERRSNGSSYRR
jgi:hypothetical protein